MWSGLDAINSLGEIMIAARSNHLPVKAGDKLAGTRVIPLVISEEKMNEAKRIAGDKPLLSLLPYQKKRCGIVTTGNEVFYGRIKDAFSPVVAAKLEEYGGEVMGVTLCGDDPGGHHRRDRGVPRGRRGPRGLHGRYERRSRRPTPAAIKATGARIVSYGAPVLPGAMFLLSYLDGKPIMGLPGCVMYARRTIFDLVLPRVMADDPVTARDLARLGNGGLCLNCETCHYPNCGFGKGGRVMSGLTHIDRNGQRRHGGRRRQGGTLRIAVAKGRIRMSAETFETIRTAPRKRATCSVWRGWRASWPAKRTLRADSALPSADAHQMHGGLRAPARDARGGGGLHRPAHRAHRR